VALLPPVVPGKLICVGRNYAKHASELGNALPKEPLIFLKATSAVIADGEAIEIPTEHTSLVHHEGELAVVMGKRCRRLSVADAPSAILGYTIMNDVTARDIQRREGKFTRAKGFDTFAPLGPHIDTDFTPHNQAIQVRVNGELRQDGRLDEMVFDVPRLISFVSQIMTLEPLDVISTGTPSGVGPMVPGDRVEVSIETLGTLTNSVSTREDT